jgi:hypothetical protein
MGSLVSELLEKALTEKRIVALRTNPSEPGNFVLGYVIVHNDETITLRTINPNGLVHGLRSIRTSEVFQADYDDRYIRNVELKENNLDKIYGRLKNPALFDEVYITVPELLQKSQHLQHLLYFITYSGPGYYAVVKHQTEEEILVECFNEYGEPDGISVFRIDDIKSIIWSDEDTRAIELRFRERKQAK